MLQHERRDLYDLQEDWIRRNSAEVKALLSEARTGFENAFRGFRHEQHQAVERLREKNAKLRGARQQCLWNGREAESRPLREFQRRQHKERRVGAEVAMICTSCGTYAADQWGAYFHAREAKHYEDT